MDGQTTICCLTEEAKVPDKNPRLRLKIETPPRPRLNQQHSPCEVSTHHCGAFPPSELSRLPNLTWGSSSHEEKLETSLWWWVCGVYSEEEDLQNSGPPGHGPLASPYNSNDNQRPNSRFLERGDEPVHLEKVHRFHFICSLRKDLCVVKCE